MAALTISLYAGCAADFFEDDFRFGFAFAGLFFGLFFAGLLALTGLFLGLAARVGLPALEPMISCKD